MEPPPAVLTLDDFLPLVGGAYAEAGAPDAALYQLVDAKAMETHDYPGRQRDAFMLTFESEAPIPEQGSRRLDLPGLGATELFLVPSARRGSATEFTAIFN